MAFPVAPRLAEIRRKVAVRLKLGAQAEQSDTMRDMLDEYIRMAFNDIVTNYAYLVNYARVEIALVHEQHSYDMPDGMRPGDIQAAYILDITGNETPIAAGLRPYERSAWKMPTSEEADNGNGTKASLPRRYEIINQNLDIYPAPDTEQWVTLVIEGKLTPKEPTHNDDRVDVDREALTRLATAYGKDDLNHPDAAKAHVLAATYIAARNMAETEGEVIRIGGHFSKKFPYNSPRSTGGDYSRYPLWNPPG